MDLLKGWKWRDKKAKRDMALMAAWITAPHLKKPLDPQKLVDDLEPKENKKTTPEQSAATLYELMGDTGIKGKLMGV